MTPPNTIPWSDLHPGQWIRWVLPNQVLVGEIVAKKGRSLKVRFTSGKVRAIPDARMYWANAKFPHRPDEYMELAPKGPKTKAQPTLDNPVVDYISAQGAEELFGVSQKDIRRWLRAGKVHGFRTKTGTWAVSSQSLGKYLAERR